MQPEVRLRFQAAQLLYSLPRIVKRSSRGAPSVFPAPRPALGNLALHSGQHTTSEGPSKWNPGLPHSPTPTLAKLPFFSLCPLLLMPGTCFGKGTSWEAYSSRLTLIKAVKYWWFWLSLQLPHLPSRERSPGMNKLRKARWFPFRNAIQTYRGVAAWECLWALNNWWVSWIQKGKNPPNWKWRWWLVGVEPLEMTRGYAYHMGWGWAGWGTPQPSSLIGFLPAGPWWAAFCQDTVQREPFPTKHTPFSSLGDQRQAFLIEEKLASSLFKAL